MMRYVIGLLFFILNISCGYAETIKIAILSEAPYSDLDAPAYLKDIPAACQAALDEKRNELRKKNVEVTLEVKQFKPTPIAPYEVLKDVYNSDAIAAVGFQSSDEVIVAAPVIQNTHFLAISPAASSRKVFTLQPNYLTLAMGNNETADQLEKFILSTLKPKKIAAVVAWDSAYSRDFYESLSTKFKTKIKLYKVQDDLQNFTETAKNIQHQKPDVILLPNFPVNTASVIKILSKMGLKSVFVGADSWGENNDNRFFSILKDTHFSAYTLRAYSMLHMSKNQKKFSEQLKRHYEANYSSIAGLYHDATRYIIDLILKNPQKNTRESILAMSQKMHTIQGVMGINCLSEKKCVQRQLIVLKINQNGFFYHKTMDEVI